MGLSKVAVVIKVEVCCMHFVEARVYETKELAEAAVEANAPLLEAEGHYGEHVEELEVLTA